MMHYYPNNTKRVVNLTRLIKHTEKRILQEHMSSRMVKCASVLGKNGQIGWQMVVPQKGLVRISLFGSDDLTDSDLEWIAEKTGKVSKGNNSGQLDGKLTELYEIYLPVTESSGNESPIGFGAVSGKSEDGFAKWPTAFSAQFDEMIRVLRNSGAVLRIVTGPADEAEQNDCRKRTMCTYDVSGIAFKDYMGRPVKIRALLLLPSEPSVRLRTVFEEAILGTKLRYLGNIQEKKYENLWENPLMGGSVLPDYAARILIMEPEIFEPIIGIEMSEEEMKKIPASHKNSKDKNAIIIGKATDTAGIKRTISIGELDLRRHYQIIGQTGTGKSTLLANIILSAIIRGHGLTFLDPHGTTIDVVLRSLPEKYADKVRVVRVGDAENPVPMNIWDSDDPGKEERNISDLCQLFGDIFNPPGEVYVGPRWERFFTTFAKASLAFLGRMSSLESIAVIAQSQDNMLKVSKAIANRYPELVETIKEEFGKDVSNDWHSTLAWFMCKFTRFSSVEQLRKTLGAGINVLDFNHVIDSDTVTLIDLASPVIGLQASSIMGSILLMKLWNAALMRKRRDMTHLIVLDECSLFRTTLHRMLSESRKFGISLILSHQNCTQLSSEIREALEANSANFSAFRLSPRDAANAAIRFDDPKMAVFLTRLDAFYAVTSLSVDGRQTAPFTLEIKRPKKMKNAEEIAARIEAKSLETLVKPYEDQRALTARQIQNLLDHPEKDMSLQKQQHAHPKPKWLNDYQRRRSLFDEDPAKNKEHIEDEAG